MGGPKALSSRALLEDNLFDALFTHEDFSQLLADECLVRDVPLRRDLADLGHDIEIYEHIDAKLPLLGIGLIWIDFDIAW